MSSPGDGARAQTRHGVHAWLSLELARLERAIDLARAAAGAAEGGGAGSVSRLSAEREQVRTRLRLLSGKLQTS
jgi:hypothetical protein